MILKYVFLIYASLYSPLFYRKCPLNDRCCYSSESHSNCLVCGNTYTKSGNVLNRDVS